MMTRADYIVLAGALKKARPARDAECFHIWEDSVRKLADSLLAQNPRFNEKAFFFASGLTSENGRYA